MTEIGSQLQTVIKKIVDDVLYIHDDVINNMCDSISNELAVRLEDEFGWTVYSPVQASVSESSNHYIVIIDARTIPESPLNTGVVVDATIRQFSNEYPEVVIETLDSEELDSLYTSFGIQEFPMLNELSEAQKWR